MRNLLFSLLACAALSTGIAGKAQAQNAPAWTGAFAAPDCRDYDEALVLTRHFYLKATADSVSLAPLAAAGGGNDYDVAVIGGVPHPLMATEDRLLVIGDMGGMPRAEWAQDWDALSFSGRNEYAGCHEAPALVPVPLARVMEHADALVEACSAEMTGACRKKLFAIADSDGNRSLSVPEFRRAGMMLFTFAALAETGAAATPALEAAYEAGVTAGAEAAGKTGALDEKDLDRIIPALSAPALKNALGSAAKTFPALRP